MWTESVASPAETAKIAQRFAQQLRVGDVVLLHGDLGAGKTTFVQALARALGVDRPVTSPTFALVQEYPLPEGGLFAHLDLYRMAQGTLLEDIGFEELLERGAVVAVEWPERAGNVFPKGAYDVTLRSDPLREDMPDARVVTIARFDQ